MPTFNQGQVNFGTPGGNTTDSASLSTRRLYDFSDRIADLAPDESPFFVYLSKVGKVPTTDSQFRFLEDRTKVHMTDRSFLIKGGQAFTAAASRGYFVDTSGGASVDFLIKGMVVQFAQNVNKDGGADTEAITQAMGRIESVSHGSSDTSIVVKTVEASSGSTTTLDDNGEAVIIGTSYEQGSGAPDVFSQKLDDGFGYTQIFKTACEMSNTARATVYRGYSDEWDRIWNLKLREHKIDIERAMLFGMKGSRSGIQYTDGIVGHIIKNGTASIATNGTIGDYAESTPYLASYAASELTFDGLLTAFQTMYDPARGGSDKKLCLVSRPVMAHFNKLNGGFVGNSLSNDDQRYNFPSSKGSFGHTVLSVDTVFGSASMVAEPLFRNNASGHMAFVDLDQVAYRPLVGNGLNRDTSITTNVQQADEDLRKDMILTEAGLEVTLPETHALINLEGV